MNGADWVVVAILVIVMVIILALVVRTGHPEVAAMVAAVAVGGGSRRRSHATLGEAMAEHATGLVPHAAYSLDGDDWSVPSTGGAAGRIPKAKKPWTEYATWAELSKDLGAFNEYLAQRGRALTHPEFDWRHVLKEMEPKLDDTAEWIGVVNADADGKTLRVVASERSPVEIGADKTGLTMASVPPSLVEKYVDRPALFLFHTHPADERCSPFPSSADITASIHAASANRFAAEVVISRLGVILYTMDWSAYRLVHSAKNPQLALSNFRHDVVSAYEAQRSWAPYTMAEYADFFPRHQLYYMVWPSPQMVAYSKTYVTTPDIESAGDYDIVRTHANSSKKLGGARLLSDFRSVAPSEEEAVAIERAIHSDNFEIPRDAMSFDSRIPPMKLAHIGGLK